MLLVSSIRVVTSSVTDIPAVEDPALDFLNIVEAIF